MDDLIFVRLSGSIELVKNRHFLNKYLWIVWSGTGVGTKRSMSLVGSKTSI
jgi:hypothetical protein